MNMSKTFLNIARKDLEASMCLYDNKLYSHAVFFLQQNIEKLNKSIWIKLNVENFTLKDIKLIIGHNSIKIYSRMIESLLNYVSKSTRESKLREYQKQRNIRKSLKKLQEVVDIFKDKEKIESIPKDIFIDIIPDLMSKKEMSRLINGILTGEDFKCILTILGIHKEFYNILSPEYEKILETFRKALDISLKLILLSLIISPSCAVNTRYPAENSNPLKIYTRHSLFIKSFDVLVKLCKNAEKSLHKLYKELDKLEA